MNLNFSSSQWDNLASLLSEGASSELLINALSFQAVINDLQLKSPTQEDLSSKEFTDSELVARKEFALEERENLVDEILSNISDIDFIDLAGNIWMDSVGRYKISLAELHHSIIMDDIKNIDFLITDNNPAEITHFHRKNGMISLDALIKGRDGVVLSDGKSIVDYDVKSKIVGVEYSSVNDIASELESYTERLSESIDRAIEDVYRRPSISSELSL
ncbi:hypothetical protein [Aeromonas veronii]|uniref:Uncharacterized protein n=1 Tax=Aeromonas veronii TaxID=654 RepID=A0A2T4MZN7_AERVE|nr:hypothetical protein [Aeromonas veronii]PTH80014.1 hypothetical protein DAA48_15735 [Aeromonas veronii]